MKLKRRELLVATAGLGGLAAMESACAPSMGSAQVVSASGSDRKQMFARSIGALGGMTRFIQQGMRVVIKPNIAFASMPGPALASHPELVKAIADECQAAGASEVKIVGATTHSPEYFRRGDFCRSFQGTRHAVKVLSFDDSYRSVNGVEISSDVLDADVVINVAQAKHDFESTVSLGLKNLIGVIRNFRRPYELNDLDATIVSLAESIQPELTVVDCTDILVNCGPAGPGLIQSSNRLLIGTDIVAVDTVALSLASYGGRMNSPADVRHLALASERGLGVSDLSRITVVNA